MTGRWFVVGDIHGCLAELNALLAGLAPRQGDGFVFLGDYVDRGPDAAGVIARLIQLRAHFGAASIFLRGNHEDMLLAYLGRGGRHGEVFLDNGGEATARSYGVHGPVRPERLCSAVPRAHLEFLESLRLWHDDGRHLMVHAGVRPGRALQDQDPHDLLWIRDEFITHPHDLDRTIVFGHTPTRTVFRDLPFKIGIDTGCVYGGMLTALELPALILHAVRHGAMSVRSEPLLA
jgi:serine/threonine protein phosphatase 1